MVLDKFTLFYLAQRDGVRATYLKMPHNFFQTTFL